jgi:hypothetical protein
VPLGPHAPQTDEGRHEGIARPGNVIAVRSESNRGSHSAPPPEKPRPRPRLPVMRLGSQLALADAECARTLCPDGTVMELVEFQNRREGPDEISEEELDRWADGFPVETHRRLLGRPRRRAGDGMPPDESESGGGRRDVPGQFPAPRRTAWRPARQLPISPDNARRSGAALGWTRPNRRLGDFSLMWSATAVCGVSRERSRPPP